MDDRGEILTASPRLLPEDDRPLPRALVVSTLESSREMWDRLAACMKKYGVGESVLLWYLWMTGVENLSPAWKSMVNYARATARYRRSHHVAINYGGVFSNYISPTPEAPNATHTFMHGSTAAPREVYEHLEPAKFNRATCPVGSLYVPQTKREQFYYGLFLTLRQMKDERRAARWGYIVSMTEVKSAEPVWRMVLDVDVELKEDSTVTMQQCIDNCEFMRENLRDWLCGMYKRDDVWVHSEWGTWRLKFSYNEKQPVGKRIGFVLRGSVHLYTNVVVDEYASSTAELVLREKLVTMPDAVSLDQCSFKPTPMRIPGCYKVMRCPYYEAGKGKKKGHHCNLCGGKMNIAIATPYDIPDDFYEWRKRLVSPLPEDVKWELPLTDQTNNIRHKRKAAEALTNQALRLKIEKESPYDRRNTPLFSQLTKEFPVYGWPIGGVTRKYNGLFINLQTRECPFKGSSHTQGNLYYFADVNFKTLELRCRHSYKEGQTHGCNMKGYPTSTKYLEISDKLKVLLFGEPTADEKQVEWLDKNAHEIMEQAREQEAAEDTIW